MATDIGFLKEFVCFRNLAEEQLEKIAQIADAVCYPEGQVLFEENQPGNSLFFLLKGDVEVFYNIGEAGQVHVDTVSGEEIVGCAALVEPNIYTATERSITEVEVLKIDAIALRKLMWEDCELGFALQRQFISVLMNRILNLRLDAAS